MKVYTTYMQSPIGWIWLQATDAYLCRANWVAQPSKEVDNLSDAPILQQAVKQLGEYFEGKRKAFDLPLEQPGTIFQQKVWGELLKIPYGERISYAELAARSGNPKACRAAGSANGQNHIFIIVPCHRVVQSGGKTGGFAYGTDMKQFLLNLEQKSK